MNKKRQHFTAWATLILIGIIIGCGGSSSVFRSDIVVRDIKLHPAVKIVPHDGSVVVSAFGDEGIQFRGAPLNLNENDYVVVVAPVLDQARQAVNHQGGYISPAKGLHIVPREHLPFHYHTPGNADHSHFIIHFGRVIERVVDTGPLAVEGSRAYSSTDDGITRKFLSHVVHSVSHAVTSGASSASHAVTSGASSATHAVTSGATSATSAATGATSVASKSVAHAATSAGSAVASAATSVGSAVGSAVHSSITSAESAVSDAVSSIGPIDDAITTIRSVGASMSTIIQAAEMDFVKAVTHPLQIINEIKDFVGFLITGDLTAHIDANGALNMAFHDLNVQSEDGSATVTIDGLLSFAYSEKGTFKIEDYKPESLEFDFDANFDTSLALTNIKGNKTIPLRRYKLEPLIVDAGIPVVITREIDVDLVLSGEASTQTSVDVNGTFSAGLKLSSSGITTHGDGNIHGSAVPPTIEGTSGHVNAIVRVTPKFKLYDSGGPYMKFDIANVLITDDGPARQIKTKVTNDLALGADLSALGYDWNYEKGVFSIDMYSHTDNY